MKTTTNDLTLVIPRQPGCPHREAAWEWASARWPYPIVIGETAGPWVKADAVQAGIDQVDTELVAIVDADVWCPNLDRAAAAVRGGIPWAIPHRFVWRLTETASARVYAGEPIDTVARDRGALEERRYVGTSGGGIVVLRRDTWDAIPMDRRFIGWGQEDESWAIALQCFHGGPARYDEPLFHLWHPPQRRDSRSKGSRRSKALYQRYRLASCKPDAMRALLDAGRPHGSRQPAHP